MDDAGEMGRLTGDGLDRASHIIGLARANAELSIASLRVARPAGHLEHRVTTLP